MDLGQAIKKGFYLFFLSLPIILINIVLFLAAGLGNAGLGFLSLGHIAVVPIAVWITQVFTGLLPILLPFVVKPSWIYKPASDLGQLAPSEIYKKMEFNVAPSYWSAHIVFFFSYLFFNALAVYNLPPLPELTDEDEWRINNRKSRSLMIMIMACVLMVLILLFRYILTDVDTFFGMFGIAVPVLGALGYGWYRAANAIGVRMMDLFGIVQQMVPVKEDTNVTYCVKPPTPA